MPRKEPERASATPAAGPRLPSFGAEMAVGPATRAYRSPLSFAGSGAGAVAASFQDEGGDTGTDMDDVGDVDAVADGDDDADDADGGSDEGAEEEGADSQSDT